MIFDGGREDWEEFRPNRDEAAPELKALVFILAFLLLCAWASYAHACGKERWSVKVASDQAVASLYYTATPTTIGWLAALPAPPNPDAQQSTRFASVETTVFEVDAVMTLIKHEADGDYHIVLRDGSETMIVEAPDPACATDSYVKTLIGSVRQRIDSHFGGPVVGRKGELNIPVQVQGVGFFDRCHGQEGRARNCIELHPVLDILFK